MSRQQFGQALIQAGALSPQQLEKALEMQQMLGGRLGTNLLEMGFLSEQALLDHLGRHRSMPTVSSRDLAKIPIPVLKSVPPKLVRRYGLVPFQVRGKTLLVASKDAGDPLQEDEIAFMTGFMVRTHLAQELQLEVALRRYYKAPLGQRFVALYRRLNALGGASAASTSSPATTPPPAVSPTPTPEPPNPALSTSSTPTPASTEPDPPTPEFTETSPNPASRPDEPSVALSDSQTFETPTPAPVSPPPTTPDLPPLPSLQTQEPSPQLGAAAPAPAEPPTAPPAPPPAAPTPPAAAPTIPASEEPSVEFIELDDADLALLRGDSGAVTQSVPPPEMPLPPAPPSTSLPSVTEPPVFEPPAETLTLEPIDEPLPLEESEDLDVLEDDDAEEPLPDSQDPEILLAWAARRLQAADIRDEIGDVLLDVSSVFYRRSALIIRRKERLMGWMAGAGGSENPAGRSENTAGGSGNPAGGSENPAGDFRALDLDAQAPSVFFGLQNPGSFWLGPLPGLPANQELISVLGGKAPRDCLVLPISLRSKIVGYLYVDNLDSGVAGTPVAEMKRLTAKAGLAFEVYILKNKIRMV